MGDAVDWRDQVPMLPDIRKRNVKSMMETLERYNPGVDEERLLEFQKFAQRFEEIAYATVTCLSHYQKKITSKMLLIENPNDWRIPLNPEVRKRIVNQMVDILKRHLGFHYPGEEGLHKLRVFAQNFEEKIFTTATSQFDYLRKISLKMLSIHQ